jgi:DNA polymerase-3 subunit delta'
MSWARVRGHDDLITSFANAWQNQRLGHAYLFVGPSGVGKFTFAKELAQALLCERKTDTLQACDQCPSCALVVAGTHPDLFFAARPEEKNELPREAINELIAQLMLKTARGHGKIAILSDVVDMNEESANIFLKYLEEPPVGSLLLLLGGASSDGILPTILSRCQIVRFRPLGAALVRELLVAHGITANDTLERLVRLGNGSIGQALAMNQDVLWNFRQRLLDWLSRPRIDAVEFAKDWLTVVDEAGKDSGSRRRRTTHILQLLLGLLQDAQRIANGVAPLVAEARESSTLAQLAERLGPDRLMSWIERTLDANVHNERYVQIDLLVEAFCDYLAR